MSLEMELQLTRCRVLDNLRRTYPGWNIRWDGVWMATRTDRRALSDGELSAGLAMTLMEDDARTLHRVLQDQRDKEAGIP